MPNPIKQVSKLQTASGFIGLQSYSEAQAEMFFGRDKESSELTNLVETNTLTIVFGKSGTGKTSLLNAGVFPGLRKHFCLPFRIRLEFENNSPDLVTQIKNVLKQEIDKYGFKAGYYPSNETLWEYFHKEPLWITITPILVFDQFEEIFTLAKTNNRFGANEQSVFWQELSDLIENSIPENLKTHFLNNKEQVDYNYKKQKTKVLFAFREEFLPEFESIALKIPSVKYSRFRLMAMNGHQAYEVVTKTWKENIDAAEAKQVVSFFSNSKTGESYDVMTVEPSLLSQVCSFIDKERLEEKSAKVSADLLKNYPKETILRAIYDEVLSEANKAMPQNEGSENGSKNPVKEFVEEKLITTQGFRTKYSLTADDAFIKQGLNVLKKKYFLREEDQFIELTHDILTPIIKSDREKRRKEIALAAERKKARKKALRLLLYAVIGAIALFLISTYSARTENDRLTDLIKDKNDSLKLLQNQIEEKIKSLGGIITPGGKPGIYSGKYPDSVTEKAIEQLQLDSSELILLKAQNDELIKKKTELEKVVIDYSGLIKSLNTRLSKAETENEDNKKVIATINNDLEILKKAYNELQVKYDKLDRAYKDHMRLYHPYPIPITPAATIDTNYNLKLNLYYGSSKNRTKAPGNLTIYLIPYNKANKRIIADAKLYEIRCDEYNLTKAVGYKMARYYKGSYVFASVSPGKYLVKICTYYGGFYTYNKTTGNTEEFVWDASPPIR